jgi:hypothetical protein
MKCGDCKFWLAITESIDPDAGECHRHAPAPLHEATYVLLGRLRDHGRLVDGDGETEMASGSLWDRKAMWPATLRAEFCGEFVVCDSASVI